MPAPSADPVHGMPSQRTPLPLEWTSAPRPSPPAGPATFDDLLDRRAVSAWESPRQIVYERGLVVIGTFRARPSHPRFADSGPIQLPVFVFPRTAVKIEHSGRRGFVADPNTVTFYNPGQVYRRAAVDPAGDLCEWFSVRGDVAAGVVAELSPASAVSPEAPFSFAAGPCDTVAYLQQRALLRRLASGQPPDLLAVEETVLRLLHRAVAAAVGGPCEESHTRPAHRDLAERLKALLGNRFYEDLGLGALGSAIGCSPFYLARVFRAVTGRSIHQYRLALRLRRSLEHVASGRDLRVVATEMGFSSHSHFCVAFRRTFGLSPSRFRRQATTTLLAELASQA